MSTTRGRVLGALTVLVTTVALMPSMSTSATADPVWQPGTPPLSTPWTGAVGPDNALPEYPRPQLTRDRWQNLNGVWEFAGTDDLSTPPVGQSLGERVLVPYPIESALSGIQRSEDRMWYRRTFEVPAGWRDGGQRLMLNFGAVDYDTTVYVNGHQVTTHRGGYDKFGVDVTDALTAAGPQELIVGVEDLTDATWQPIGKQRRVPDRGIFYTGSSGIWQTVWLEPVSASHVTKLDMTPHLADGSLALTARTAGDATVEAVAYDGGREVGRVTGPANSPLRLPVPDAKPWSPDSPFLYDLEVSLVDGQGQAVDRVGSYFGMREIGMKPGADGKLRMTLNGEILFHLATLDQGFWPDGIHTAPTDEALRFDLEQHKVMGFNAVRKHIKVEPDRWFYAADQLGLLVWQDMPAMKTSDQTPPPDARAEFERQLHTMVDQHDSWTSVVAWVPFNEGWGEWDRGETGRIADEVKSWDPSRLVNAHSGVNCCASHGDSGRGDMIDHHAYVGPAQPVPDGRRVSVDGEHGGFGLEVEDHMWFGEGHAYEMEPDSATLTRRYVENQRDVLSSAQSCGISGAIYTQITDVEHEVNGFFTYDRQVDNGTSNAYFVDVVGLVGRREDLASSTKSTPSDCRIWASTKWPMRALAITGMDTAAWMPSIISGSLIRATPPSRRMSAGTRSSAITAHAPASSAILACSAVTTSMMTPPFSISARPRLTGNDPVRAGADRVLRPSERWSSDFGEVMVSRLEAVRPPPAGVAGTGGPPPSGGRRRRQLDERAAGAIRIGSPSAAVRVNGSVRSMPAPRAELDVPPLVHGDVAGPDRDWASGLLASQASSGTPRQHHHVVGARLGRRSAGAAAVLAAQVRAAGRVVVPADPVDRRCWRRRRRRRARHGGARVDVLKTGSGRPASPASAPSTATVLLYRLCGAGRCGTGRSRRPSALAPTG